MHLARALQTPAPITLDHNIMCVVSEKMAKLENEHVIFVYRQHPQFKLVNKFGHLNTGGFRLSDTLLSAFPIINADFRLPKIKDLRTLFHLFLSF